MRQKLEMAANIAVIIAVVYIGFNVLRARLSQPSTYQDGPQVGEKLPVVPGYSWGGHSRTLVLALRNGCHYCEESAPFYKRLLAQVSTHSGPTSVIAVFPDDTNIARAVTASEGLSIPAVGGVPLQQIRVSGTPTLILVDGTGRVAGTWVGMLSPKKELEVFKAIGVAEGTGICRD